MSFEMFMKKNKIEKPNEKYAATRSLVDVNGEPLIWEFRHLSSKEDQSLRDKSTQEVPVIGRKGAYRPKINTSQYINSVVAASTVVPDLNNAALQDSYGVLNPEDLLRALVDDPGEYSDLCTFVMNINGFGGALDEEVEEAKN